MADTPGINIDGAPTGWLDSWFRLTAEQRAVIEMHLETCQMLAATLTTLDMADRSQYPTWKQIRTDSGWTQQALNKAIPGMSQKQLSVYESGKQHPRPGEPADRYNAILTNLATDQYHHHLTQMAWSIYWTEQGDPAPEIITADDDFMRWTRQQADHPILGTLPHSLPYDPLIDWPLKVSAA